MSSKSSKKPKALTVPRTTEEIQKEYTGLVYRAGNAQYMIKVYSDELAGLNEQLLKLNREGSARQQLDAAAKAKAEDKTEGQE